MFDISGVGFCIFFGENLIERGFSIMKKRPTLKTIAEIAGVSHVTISQALRDFPVISKATTKRIKEIAKEVGYTPNLAARNLALRKPTSIGIIVPTLDHTDDYSNMIHLISQTAALKGLSLLLGSCNHNVELEKSYCKMMCENRVGALIIAPCTNDISHIKEICGNIVPTIFLGGKITANEDYIVSYDYEYSGKLAVDHFHTLGYDDIGFFVCEPNDPTVQRKIAGYRNSMKDFGLNPKIYQNTQINDAYHAGFLLTEELLAANQMPKAIWCVNDLMALGSMEVLHRQHVAIPAAVAIMGHDNLFFDTTPSLSLTSILLPPQKIVTAIMKMIDNLLLGLEETDYKKSALLTNIQGELIPRKSTLG